MKKMLSFGKTDIGIVREKNEDNIFFSDNKIGDLDNLYIICDGMGGHKAGDVASKMAIESFLWYIKKNKCDNKNMILDFLVSAGNYANKIVYEESKKNLSYNGMGTTLTACCVVDKKIYCLHAGDSRIYIINDFELKQLSCDHSYVNEMIKSGEINLEQAKNHPKRNIITKAVGTEKNIKFDAFVFDLDLNKKNYLLMCSDGLNCVLDDKEIFNLLDINNFDLDETCLKEKVDKLINVANEKGGFDNISVILICEVQ